MDEIDKVVDNLFGQYIPKKKDVAAVPSEPPPSNGPEPDPSLDSTSTIMANAHPDIVQKPSEAHPDIIKKPTPPQPKPSIAAKAAVKAQKTVAARESGKKKAGSRISVPVDIAEIKKQTAKMLRHLHKSIKSENWWHKLYYANKFLFIAVDISKQITKRKKQA